MSFTAAIAAKQKCKAIKLVFVKPTKISVLSVC